MPNDLGACRVPPGYSSPPSSLARRSQLAPRDALESASDEVRPQNLVDEVLFGVAFDVHQKSGHSSEGAGPAAELVLFPQLPEAIVLQPLGEIRGVQTPELCSFVHPIGDQDVLRLEMVQ